MLILIEQRNENNYKPAVIQPFFFKSFTADPLPIGLSSYLMLIVYQVFQKSFSPAYLTSMPIAQYFNFVNPLSSLLLRAQLVFSSSIVLPRTLCLFKPRIPVTSTLVHLLEYITSILIVYSECGSYKSAARCVRIMWNIEDMMFLIQRGQCSRLGTHFGIATASL